MTSPTVSVIVSVYNSEQYLPECLASLRAQTLKTFEVIMVDPGSKDATEALCRRQAAEDPRFRYFHFEGSSRVSFCRAKAVQEARAPLIAILDSDDWALPLRLETQATWMDRHPETILTGTYYRVINELGWITRISPLKVREDIEIRWRLLFGNCLTHSTVMFRKEAALRAGNYNPEIKAGEDLEFYARLLGQGRMAVIPIVLGAWRSHGKSLSRTQPIEEQQDFIRTIQKAVRLNLEEDISLAVAAAVYTQSPLPADSLATFTQVLALIERADRTLRQSFAPSAKAKRDLSRSVFLQLLQLMTKNSGESWWQSAEESWAEATRRLSVVNSGYHWYLDAGLFSYYKALLKCDLRFLFMTRLY